ncbi:hypothetical protein KILIM_012_00120 [Kineosphaera limosa NBRC 100340]|uniref:Uncharacterized protein n=1 Tax=Kineosphaera limosa NBRC 100340 TaxID=1184609 RepID=K6VF89_9MICO|nr:hypothetical protein KILIM_012_00120 [Kineosphaera limosa NBRC 100340]
MTATAAPAPNRTFSHRFAVNAAAPTHHQSHIVRVRTDASGPSPAATVAAPAASTTSVNTARHTMVRVSASRAGWARSDTTRQADSFVAQASVARTAQPSGTSSQVVTPVT